MSICRACCRECCTPSSSVPRSVLVAPAPLPRPPHRPPPPLPLLPQNANDVRTTIQALGTISRHVGYRLGRNLQHILPMLMRFMGAVSDESLANEQGHELRENALQALESFVLRCPRQVTEFIPAIVSVRSRFCGCPLPAHLSPVGCAAHESVARALPQLVRDFVQFDPNYTYDEEEDGMGDGAEMDDELDDMGYDDVGNFSDDDDTRHAACLRLPLHRSRSRAHHAARAAGRSAAPRSRCWLPLWRHGPRCCATCTTSARMCSSCASRCGVVLGTAAGCALAQRGAAVARLAGAGGECAPGRHQRLHLPAARHRRVLCFARAGWAHAG